MVMRLPVRLTVDVMAGIAGFLRDRLAELAGPQAADAAEPARPDTVIVAALAPFATTSYARARLLRQLHACGLLRADESGEAARLVGVAR